MIDYQASSLQTRISRSDLYSSGLRVNLFSYLHLCSIFKVREESRSGVLHVDFIAIVYLAEESAFDTDHLVRLERMYEYE